MGDWLEPRANTRTKASRQESWLGEAATAGLDELVEPRVEGEGAEGRLGGSA